MTKHDNTTETPMQSMPGSTYSSRARRPAYLRYITPNRLTVLRMCMVPLFIALLMTGHNIAADIVFIIASLTDTFDGYLARKYHMISVFGKFMDPLADKLLVCSALICMVELGYISGIVVILIVGRDFIISGFRLVAAERGTVIAANIWGKVKTVVQMVMVIIVVLQLPGIFDIIGKILILLAAVLTVVSLVIYLRDNRQVLQDVN